MCLDIVHESNCQIIIELDSLWQKIYNFLIFSFLQNFDILVNTKTTTTTDAHATLARQENENTFSQKMQVIIFLPFFICDKASQNRLKTIN